MFDLICVICERQYELKELKLHYENHTKDELVEELMEVSNSLQKYGEYA